MDGQGSGNWVLGRKLVAHHYEVLGGNECSGARCIKAEEWLIRYSAIGANSMAEVVE